jgi:hypothetical protein
LLGPAGTPSYEDEDAMAIVECTALVAVFERREQVAQALDELQATGFRPGQLGVALRGDLALSGLYPMERLASGQLSGHGSRSTGLTPRAVGLLPELGAMAAGGLLAGLHGEAAGVFAGGLLGSQLAAGLPEDDAPLHPAFQAAWRSCT